jgi:hypothetical protein
MGRLRLLSLMLAVPALPAQAAKPPTVLTLKAAPQPGLMIRIKEANLPVRVSLGFERALVLNQAPAEFAKLKPFPLLGKQTVKNPLIPGGEAVFRGNFYDVSAAGLPKLTVPTVWVNKAVHDGIDGILSVMAIAADRVVFEQPAAPTGGQRYVVATTGRGDVGGEIKLDGVKISVRFALDAPRTVMNANAAQALIDAGLLRRNRSLDFWTPFPQVRLPIEGLNPAAGATVLGLPLLNPAVRITEAQAKELDARARAGTSTAAEEEDAIVVSGAKRRTNRNRPWILIGRDVLTHCERIEMDKPGRQWLLTCNFAAPAPG